MAVFLTADKTRSVSTTMRLDPNTVLPLHAELFLLAHDDDTGAVLINRQCLAVGLAGALLLELSLQGRVAVDYLFDEFRWRWQPRPGTLAVIRPGPAGSAPLDTALDAVKRTIREHRGSDELRAWMRSFAGADLYERVRAALVAVGLLQRTERRRLGGLLKTHTYLPVHYGYAVRARARIRDAVAYHTRPDQNRYPAPTGNYAALCGLVAALDLAEFLYDAMPTPDLTSWLWHAATAHPNTTISSVLQAVDAARGDLAVAALR